MSSYPQYGEENGEKVSDYRKKTKFERIQNPVTMSDRFLKLLHEKKMSQSEFGKRIGVVKSTISSNINVTSVLRIDIIQGIATIFGPESLWYVINDEPLTLETFKGLESQEPQETYVKKSDLKDLNDKLDLIMNHLKINPK